MPQHISVYSLIVEPNTLMEKWVNEEKFDLPLDEEERNQYAYVKIFWNKRDINIMKYLIFHCLVNKLFIIQIVGNRKNI